MLSVGKFSGSEKILYFSRNSPNPVIYFRFQLTTILHRINEELHHKDLKKDQNRSKNWCALFSGHFVTRLL